MALLLCDHIGSPYYVWQRKMMRLQCWGKNDRILRSWSLLTIILSNYIYWEIVRSEQKGMLILLSSMEWMAVLMSTLVYSRILSLKDPITTQIIIRSCYHKCGDEDNPAMFNTLYYFSFRNRAHLSVTLSEIFVRH